MIHSDALELLAGAALDDLDETEGPMLLAHRSNCSHCAREAAAIDETLADLARLVPRLVPPAGLEARILSAISAIPPGSHAAADPARPAGVTRPAVLDPQVVAADGGRWSWLRRQRFGLAALAIAVVFALASVTLQLRSADLRSQITLQDQALAVLANPAHVTVPLKNEIQGAPTAVAWLVYLPSTSQAYLMAIGLPPTPGGHVYQLWYADTAGVHPLGTYRYDGTGAFVAPFGVDLSGSAAAMVTLEGTSGASGDQPGQQVVFGQLSGPG